MQFINYFSASIISFSGLLIGILLAKIAPEEQKPLKKKFSLLRKIFLFFIFLFLIFYYYNNALYFVTLIGYFIFLLYVELKIDDLLKKSMIIYIMLGILFFLSLENLNLLAIESSLILLYGLPASSLIYNHWGKNIFKVLSYNIGFIIIANLLFFI